MSFNSHMFPENQNMSFFPQPHFSENFNQHPVEVSARNCEYADNLRPVDEVLSQYRPIFSNFRYFNIIQSQVLDAVLHTDESVVVSAPTGSGKTVILELAIVRFLMISEQTSKMDYKIVYVAPMKALCEERLVDWNTKFAQFGLNCISVTGDSEDIDIYSLLQHNLIITTPEKWDSLTRKWKDNKTFFTLIKLFMIDEVHLLGENIRGATLEVVVSRMKAIQNDLTTDAFSGSNFYRIRFAAISACVPNVEDMAEWLSMPGLPAKWFKFADDMRPVKLNKVILSYPCNPATHPPFKFDLILNYKLQYVLMNYAEGKPTLIFCSTRKSVEMTSKYVTQNLTINLNQELKETLQASSSNIGEPKLKESVLHGVGFHHAGLSPDDKRMVEELFRNAHLPILITTSTLSMGVNLPAHLVIIKSTKYYSDGQYQDYTESMLMQMIGRAGRPQYDTSATAVILTSNNDKHKFESMVGGIQSIESSLHKHLAEHLNSEVVLRTITDLSVAMQWLTSTFLHIRAKKNPRYYGLSSELTPEQIDKKLLSMCQIEINRLAKAGMLTIDFDDVILTPTSTGLLMAKYYIAFETMKLFSKVSGTEVLQQILGLISSCQEFSEIYLRVNDKRALNLLNKCRSGATIRFPFNGKIRTVDMKINCLIQAVLGCLPISDYALAAESQKIMRIGERISRCLAEYLKTKDNCYSALLSSLILAKCFHVRLWENSPYVSRQLTKIGNALSSNLVTSGKTTFQSILDTNPRDIERILTRKSPFGSTVQKEIEHLPKFELTLQEMKPPNAFVVHLRLCLKNAEALRDKCTVNVHNFMTLLVGNSNNEIIAYEKHTHNYFIAKEVIVKTFKFPEDYQYKIKAHFISEDWVGIDCQAEIIPSHIPDNSEPKNKQTKTIEHKPTVVTTTKRSLKSSPASKKPSHVQTFVDTYFRKTKPKKEKNPKQKTETITKPLPNSKQEQNKKENTSVSKNLDKKQDAINEYDIITQSTVKSFVQEMTNDVMHDCQKDNNYSNSLTTNPVATTGVTNLSQNNFVSAHQKMDAGVKQNLKTARGCTLQSSPSVRGLNKPNLPIQECAAHFGNRNTEPSKPKHMLAIRQFDCMANFEKSLYDSDDGCNESISVKFQYKRPKKLLHDVIETSKCSLNTPADSWTSERLKEKKLDEYTSDFTDRVKPAENVASWTPQKLNKRAVAETVSAWDLESSINETVVRSGKKAGKSKIDDSISFTKSSEVCQKSLTWRSPLVTYAEGKHSPNLAKNWNYFLTQPIYGKNGRDCASENVGFPKPLNSSPHIPESNCTRNSSSSLHQNILASAGTFPWLNQSFTQSQNTPEPVDLQNRTNNKKSCDSNTNDGSGSETSFLSTTLQSDSNSTGRKTAKSTLYRNKLKPGCSLPLSDHACTPERTEKEIPSNLEKNLNIAEEDLLVSQSFLDELGLNQMERPNQIKQTELSQFQQTELSQFKQTELSQFKQTELSQLEQNELSQFKQIVPNQFKQTPDPRSNEYRNPSLEEIFSQSLPKVDKHTNNQDVRTQNKLKNNAVFQNPRQTGNSVNKEKRLKVNDRHEENESNHLLEQSHLYKYPPTAHVAPTKTNPQNTAGCVRSNPNLTQPNNSSFNTTLDFNATFNSAHLNETRQNFQTRQNFMENSNERPLLAISQPVTGFHNFQKNYSGVGCGDESFTSNFGCKTFFNDKFRALNPFDNRINCDQADFCSQSQNYFLQDYSQYDDGPFFPNFMSAAGRSKGGFCPDINRCKLPRKRSFQSQDYHCQNRKWKKRRTKFSLRKHGSFSQCNYNCCERQQIMMRHLEQMHRYQCTSNEEYPPWFTQEVFDSSSSED